MLLSTGCPHGPPRAAATLAAADMQPGEGVRLGASGVVGATGYSKWPPAAGAGQPGMVGVSAAWGCGLCVAFLQGHRSLQVLERAAGAAGECRACCLSGWSSSSLVVTAVVGLKQQQHQWVWLDFCFAPVPDCVPIPLVVPVVYQLQGRGRDLVGNSSRHVWLPPPACIPRASFAFEHRIPCNSPTASCCWLHKLIADALPLQEGVGWGLGALVWVLSGPHNMSPTAMLCWLTFATAVP